jgi:hypothetical protein
MLCITAMPVFDHNDNGIDGPLEPDSCTLIESEQNCRFSPLYHHLRMYLTLNVVHYIHVHAYSLHSR